MVCCPFGACWLLPFLPALVRLACSLPVVGPPLTQLVERFFPSLLGSKKAGRADCCPPGSWPRLDSDEGHALAGVEMDLPGGVHAYVSRPKTPTGTAVIVVHDIFGLASGGRARSICDALAADGFLVVLPDLYGGGDSIEAHGGVEGLRSGAEESVAWLKSHAWSDVDAKLDAVYAWLMDEGVPAQNSKLSLTTNRIGMLGFCWGAWVAAKASATGRIACAVHAHPSWKIEPSLFGEPVEGMAARIRVPTLLLPASNDDDAFRDGTYAKIIKKNAAVAVEAIDFPSMTHGFIVRGSPSDAAVMAEVERALKASSAFLRAHMPPVE